MPPTYPIEVVNIEHFYLIYKHSFIMKCDNKMILTTYYRKKGVSIYEKVIWTFHLL